MTDMTQSHAAFLYPVLCFPFFMFSDGELHCDMICCGVMIFISVSHSNSMKEFCGYRLLQYEYENQDDKCLLMCVPPNIKHLLLLCL